MPSLEQLQYSNSFGRLPEDFHGRLQPTPLLAAHLASFNATAAALIDLDPGEAGRAEFVDYLNGSRPLPGADPIAMLYAGHQFGHYVEQLGDGRAILLGEVLNRRGERWELQLKGAGPTPYSRRGDGRAVLRSTVREYLCSEAMHGLGIPTTRALCMLGSEEEVYREQIEAGALLLRMAPSHVRFGSFEIFFYRGQHDRLRQLADYVIEHHYPELREREDRYPAFYQEVVARTARLIAQWQLVGFAHGVMNTDNMSILGLTLDYGPFGFLDDYQPGFICNHSDHHGRYAFDRQPDIGLWNVSCLAQALLPLLHPEPEAAVELAKAGFDLYQEQFRQAHDQGMAAKLGLRERQQDDAALAQGWLDLLAANHCDHTNSFRTLAHFDDPCCPLRDSFVDRAAFDTWAQDYRQRLAQEGMDAPQRRARMQAVNPKYILRNYLAEQAIRDAQGGDYREIDRLLALLQRPFDEQPEMVAYAAPPPDWGRRLEVSCSS
ncbi:MAG TPA: YdiU family protein [Gammaproteobacteria bacterium]|nr:YdiU family protein [Gammaproteobacteria bacterium]